MPLKRAYDATAKEKRRQAILDAAARLLGDGNNHLPNASQIAEAAGVAKGTMYLYFRTKEDIFGLLLIDGWRKVMRAASNTLDEQHSRSQHVRAFIDAFSTAVATDSNLMRLDALGRGVLQENMSADALMDFKSLLQRDLDDFGGNLDKKLELKPGRGSQLILRTHALTRGMWQSSQDLSEEVFSAELKDVLTEYWRGALAV